MRGRIGSSDLPPPLSALLLHRGTPFLQGHFTKRLLQNGKAVPTSQKYSFAHGVSMDHESNDFAS